MGMVVVALCPQSFESSRYAGEISSGLSWTHAPACRGEAHYEVPRAYGRGDGEFCG